MKTKVFIISPHLKQRVSSQTRSDKASLDEAIGLAEAIELEIKGKRTLHLENPSPATLIGSGVVEELKPLFESLEIQLVIVDFPLSPIQQRNLERQWKVKVIDRTGLILEIFGARARTAEGRLQVELASLQYQRGRLVRAWTHLERQRGGFGFTGGPGEKQIELDRRMIDNRVEKIKSELQKTVRTRRLQRSARDKVPYPIVALIGYTNAGKSTLFNYLTKADVFAKDLLFATLDPTMRLLKLNSGQEVILSDTVGFIADLPTTLIAAFRATLEEVCEADIILHVRDISHEDTEHQKQDVDNVLKELGLEHAFDNGIVIEVWNKYDLLSDELKTFYDNKASSHSSCLPISAITGTGIEALKNLIDKKLASNKKMIEIILPSSAGSLLAWCYRQGMIRSRFDHDDGIHLTLSIAHDKLSLFWKKYRDEVEFEK